MRLSLSDLETLLMDGPGSFRFWSKSSHKTCNYPSKIEQ